MAPLSSRAGIVSPGMDQSLSSAVRTVLAGSASVLVLSGCGSAGHLVNGPQHSSSAQSSSQAVEAAVRDLFSALKSRDDSAACRDYTSGTQANIVVAAKKVAAETRHPLQADLTCSESLQFLFTLTPQSARALQSLGSPKFSQVRVNGSNASVTFTASELGGLIGHSTVTLQRVSGRWLADRATSLSLSHS
jgi:hypothetical protein